MTEFRLSDILTNWLKSRTAFSWTAILKFVGTIWRKISKEMFWSVLGTIPDTSGSSILSTAVIAQKRDTTSLTGLLNCKKKYYTTGMKSWQGLMRVARNNACRNAKKNKTYTIVNQRDKRFGWKYLKKSYKKSRIRSILCYV